MPPTRVSLDQSMAVLKEEIARRKALGIERAVILVHFAGHGDQNGTLQLKDQRLPVANLLEMLAATGADQVFALLDACYLRRFVVESDKTRPV